MEDLNGKIVLKFRSVLCYTIIVVTEYERKR